MYAGYLLDVALVALGDGMRERAVNHKRNDYANQRNDGAGLSATWNEPAHLAFDLPSAPRR